MITSTVPHRYCDPRGDSSLSVRKQFVVFEESFQFSACCFVTITRVCNVDHHIDAEFITQCSRRCFRGIGHAEHIADEIHRILSFQRKRDDRSRTHERFHFRVKRFVRNVRVVFAKNVGIKPKHLAAANLQTRLFEACNDFAADAFCNGVGL